MNLSHFLCKVNKIIIPVCVILMSSPVGSHAQLFPAKNYPQQYFKWPVATAPAISANFGELRPNHFHMGLDCKTDKKQNLPVLAAADGYISKVKIEPGGFGKCIYINHPNGFTTLYAHLNDYFPELDKYVTSEQYRLEQWDVFLEIPAGLFPVKKGQFIANSGNSGASQGPHLHFEIRDTKTDKVLNPLLFGMPIDDHIPPDVLRLVVYDRNYSTYEQSPFFISLRKQNGIYAIPAPVLKVSSDKISFGISAFDRYTGSTNRNGIYEAILYEDSLPVIGFQADNISYLETRNVNAHIDYKIRSTGGPFVQHLSRLPGYKDGVYKEFSGDGVIQLKDTLLHVIKIEVKDANGNSSVVRFNITLGTIAKRATSKPVIPQQFEFKPGYLNVFENEKVRLFLTEDNLYDSIRFRYTESSPGSVYPVFSIHQGSIPLHGYFTLNIKGPSLYPGKMVMRRTWGFRNEFVKAFYENGWYKADFREFGNFQLLPDTIPPTIRPIGFKDGMNCSKLRRLAFVITDNTHELRKFRAELDGNWLRFTNDKGLAYIYIFDEHCQPGEHELKLGVEDCVGNLTEKTYHFTR